MVPMDGFHLAQVELERLPRATRKGAPDTFDSADSISLFRRLRAQSVGEIVYAPACLREIEEPIAVARPIFSETPLVITEGNYLLLDGPWAPVRESWTSAGLSTRMKTSAWAWLLARHMTYGRSLEAAGAWIERRDVPNARVVRPTREKADVFVNIAHQERAAAPESLVSIPPKLKAED